MPNPKTTPSSRPKMRPKSSTETTPAPEQPEPEKSTNGQQPDQPPVMETPVDEPQSSAPTASAQPTNPERISALAVVCVMSSLLGFLGITSLLGLALGIVALKQMSVKPELTGRHLAILGVCLSTFWLVLWLALGSALWVGLALVEALINAIF